MGPNAWDIEVRRTGNAATLTWHAKPFAHASPITFEELRGLVAEFTQALREWERARNENYYAVLGVARDASHEEIKRVYRRLVRQYHPDGQVGDEEKLKTINQAYAVVGNLEQRQAYDRTR